MGRFHDACDGKGAFKMKRVYKGAGKVEWAAGYNAEGWLPGEVVGDWSWAKLAFERRNVRLDIVTPNPKGFLADINPSDHSLNQVARGDGAQVLTMKGYGPWFSNTGIVGPRLGIEDGNYENSVYDTAQYHMVSDDPAPQYNKHHLVDYEIFQIQVTEEEESG
jgi:hypothetical protein